MIRLILWLFYIKRKTISFTDYHCDTTLKLDRRLRTPLGSNVTVVNVAVDIDYLVDGDDIRIRGARLTRSGDANVFAKHTGEAWRERSICSGADLARAVAQDLQDTNGWLWRAMHAKWRDEQAKAAVPRPFRKAIGIVARLCILGLAAIFVWAFSDTVAAIRQRPTVAKDPRRVPPARPTAVPAAKVTVSSSTPARNGGQLAEVELISPFASRPTPSAHSAHTAEAGVAIVAARPAATAAKSWQARRRWRLANGETVEGSLKTWSPSKVVLIRLDGTELVTTRDAFSEVDKDWVSEASKQK